jgi:hypothetical protein
MVHLWRVSDDYPQSLIGAYQRATGPDRFLLKKGERLSDQAGIPAIRFEGTLQRLREFDCLANDALVPLVNAKCGSLLMALAPDDVELVAARVEASDGVTEEFSFVNVISKVKGIDHERSSYRYVPGTKQIMSFRKLEYVETCLGEHGLARDAEYMGHLLVADRIATRLRREAGRGIDLLEPTQIAW